MISTGFAQSRNFRATSSRRHSFVNEDKQTFQYGFTHIIFMNFPIEILEKRIFCKNSKHNIYTKLAHFGENFIVAANFSILTIKSQSVDEVAICGYARMSSSTFLLIEEIRDIAGCIKSRKVKCNSISKIMHKMNAHYTVGYSASTECRS